MGYVRCRTAPERRSCWQCQGDFTANRMDEVFCSGPCGRKWKAARRPSNAKVMRTVDSQGYVWIGRKMEHRLVMERAIGRPLTDDEDVHHRNGRRTDNRLRNLQLLTHSEHASLHHAERLAERKRNQTATPRQLRLERQRAAQQRAARQRLHTQHFTEVG